MTFTNTPDEDRVAKIIDDWLREVDQNAKCAPGKQRVLEFKWKKTLLECLAKSSINFSEPENVKSMQQTMNELKVAAGTRFIDWAWDSNEPNMDEMDCSQNSQPRLMCTTIEHHIKRITHPKRLTVTRTKPKKKFSYEIVPGVHVELNPGEHRRIGYRQASLRKMRTYGRASEGGEYF